MIMKKILMFIAIIIAVVVQAKAQKVFGIDITTTCKRYCYQLATKLYGMWLRSVQMASQN